MSSPSSTTVASPLAANVTYCSIWPPPPMTATAWQPGNATKNRPTGCAGHAAPITSVVSAGAATIAAGLANTVTSLGVLTATRFTIGSGDTDSTEVTSSTERSHEPAFAVAT